MRGWSLALLCVVACRGRASTETIAPPPRPEPITVRVGCDARLPAAACAMFRKAIAGQPRLTFADDASTKLAPCARGDRARVGEWRYALVAPLYSPVEDVSKATFDAMWRGDHERELAMSAETSAMLATLFGSARSTVAPHAHLELTATEWAVVPADELVPQDKVVTIERGHPLEAGRDGPLSVPLCIAGVAAEVRNIDPARVTTLAMTGVTAMARFTAKLMDDKGTTYPARDVVGWFDHTDFVHVSNEVSFVPTCKPKGDRLEAFCSRESYIELLEAIHTNIVELDGSHLDDFGRETFAHTLDMYDARGWHHFGGGRDQLDATKPLLVEHAGNKLAFVGCNMPHSTSHTIRNGPDVGYCDLERLDWQIRDLRKRGYAAIVSIQHEEVNTHDPPDLLVRDFRRLARSGAAVVFGSQAHWAHPFEVHDGAFVHYGAGNLFFDQDWPGARDAVADRFYFYNNRLLTVGHLFTRLEEEGRPRPMIDKERAQLLRTLAAALAKLPPADPWGEPRPRPERRQTPDSFLLGKEAILLGVAVPEAIDNAQHYPLVIDLHTKAAIDADALYVTLRKPPTASGSKLAKAITEFMVAKYSADPARVTLR